MNVTERPWNGITDRLSAMSPKILLQSLEPLSSPAPLQQLAQNDNCEMTFANIRQTHEPREPMSQHRSRQ